MVKSSKTEERYPRLNQLGLTVHDEPIKHVKWDDLNKAIEPFKDTFYELFGRQTCLIEGPYAWDTEVVLEMIASGKQTGTQLFPD